MSLRSIRFKPELAIWLVLFVAFVLIVWSTDYSFRDPDSRLYSNISQKLSEQPLDQWIAPQWYGFWKRDGPFREHPPGTFWVNATLIRLGAPPGQAAAIANFLYYLLTFFFAFKIGRRARDSVAGWAMVWAILLMPVTLQDLIRGNLEPPLTMAMVIAMYGIMRADSSWGARAALVVALVFAVFVKGMQGAFVGIAAGLYWLFWTRDRARFFTLFIGALILIGMMALFEWAYRTQTGEAFWLRNFAIQAGIAVKSHSPFAKLYNLVWYLGRLLYFALPWTILLLSRWWRKGTTPFPTDAIWRWLLVSAGALVLIMSFFERRADRYIFPAYTLLAMAGGWYAALRFPRLRSWLSGDSRRQQLAFAGALLLAVALKVFVAKYFYSNIQIWRD
jgi:4-amino-4-deoxy-L-arabinose transferase-like glycosyltransferase